MLAKPKVDPAEGFIVTWDINLNDEPAFDPSPRLGGPLSDSRNYTAEASEDEATR
jgi:hypothetical protein